jgi:hypothetical protein
MQAESTIIAPGGGIYRVNATFIPVFHVGAAATLFFWSRQWAATAVLLYRLAGSLGIGIGYHRLLTRRGFRTLKPVEYFLTVCGMLALHDGASNWVATNRIRHPRPSRHVARQLGYAPVGLATLRDGRRLAQQLVGGDADIRRGVAQQPPRPPGVGAPRPRLVRGERQLVGSLRSPTAGGR